MLHLPHNRTKPNRPKMPKTNPKQWSRLRIGGRWCYSEGAPGYKNIGGEVGVWDLVY